MHVENNGARQNGKSGGDTETESAAGGRGKRSLDEQQTADPLAQLKADGQKAKINAIWEQLKARDPFVQSKGGRGHVPTLPSQSKSTKPVPGWMVSLGIVSSKGVSGTKLATGDRIAGGEVLKSTDGGTEAKESDKDQIEAEREEARKVAAAALAAAKAAAGAASTEGKIEISEVREFAGEEVQITKYVDPNSKAGQASQRRAEMQAASSSGLDALLQQISKKPKLNILDKSRKDWGEFKEEKGLDLELEAYKKSGDKYLDKVAFLQRSDVREYEKERDGRLAVQLKRRTDTPVD